MSVERWLAFTGVLLVVLCVPGPDFAVVLRHAMTSARNGAGAAAGIVTGLTLHTAAAALGLSALVAAHPRLLIVLRVVGAGYLFWLGAQALSAALRPPSVPVTGHPQRSGHPFRQGLVGNLLNPKALLFFLGLIPQFIVPGSDATPQILLMAATTIGAAVLWWAVVIGAAARGAAVLHGTRARRVVDASCGAALVGVSLSVVRG